MSIEELSESILKEHEAYWKSVVKNVDADTMPLGLVTKIFVLRKNGSEETIDVDDLIRKTSKKKFGINDFLSAEMIEKPHTVSAVGYDVDLSLVAQHITSAVKRTFKEYGF